VRITATARRSALAASVDEDFDCIPTAKTASVCTVSYILYIHNRIIAGGRAGFGEMFRLFTNLGNVPRSEKYSFWFWMFSRHRSPQFSGLIPVRRVTSLHHCIHITGTYDWFKLTFIISFTDLTAFALYNHACYNIEMLIKLLTLLFNVYKRFFNFCHVFTFLTFFYFNMVQKMQTKRVEVRGHP